MVLHEFWEKVLLSFYPKVALQKDWKKVLPFYYPEVALHEYYEKVRHFFTQKWASKKIILFCDIYFTHKWPHIQIGDHLWAKYDVTHMCEGAIETLVRVIRSESKRVQERKRGRGEREEHI